MKKIYFLTFIVLISFLMSGVNAQTQTFVWSDEFDYYGLPDANKWGNEVGYVRNNELQYYTDRDIDNQIVRNGYLEIIGLKESFGVYNYTSASINTKNKFGFTYGTIEARMKLPAGQGLWPAFWMLGTNIDQVGWPSCGEIDIVEHVNNDNYIAGTVHWSSAKGNRHLQDQGYYTVDVTQWHTYSVVWNESAITWYVDGIQYHQKSILGAPDGTQELHMPQYILLNLAIGGNWPGAPDGTTVFPATMYVDYVRVYQNTTNPPASDNLILNPGFEDGLSLSPWTSWGTVSVVANNAFSGSNALYVKGPGAAEQIVTVAPNTTYTLSGFGKVSGRRQSVLLGVKEYGGIESSVVFDQTVYANKSLQFTTGSANTTAKIFYYVSGSLHAAYGDDFSVIPSTLKASNMIPETENVTKNIDVTVYPNPLSDANLTISIANNNEDVEISVFNIQGQEVYKNSTRETSVGINRGIFGKAGLYLITIKAQNRIITKRVIVE